MSNIKDVARHARTSPSTVSRVVNNSGYVSDDVRERVRKAIAELGYRPNAGARLIRGSNSRMIGILVPALDLPFFSILAQSIESVLFAQGYRSLICCTAEDDEREERYVETLLAQKVDGVIIASSHTNVKVFEMLDGQGVPCVAIDRPLKDRKTPVVRVNHQLGGRMMAEHLVSLGHEKIGVIGAPSHSQPIIARVRGVRQFLSKRGLEAPVVSLGEAHNFEAAYRESHKFLSDNPQLTAICALSDVFAMGCLTSARELGRDVPTELSVVGFDNLPMSQFASPQLTTISQPISKLGSTAARKLIEIVESSVPDTLSRQSYLPLELIVRGSTMPRKP